MDPIISAEKQSHLQSSANEEKGKEHSRTVAILTRSACKTHRLTIQSRIASSGFSILEERLEQWSIEEDIDFLRAFLQPAGEVDEDVFEKWIAKLTGEPIFVMLLQRHRAVELWQEFCRLDLDTAEQSIDGNGSSLSTSGLRAEYGSDTLFGSTPESVQRQIALCFPEHSSAEALQEVHVNHAAETVTAISSHGAFVVRENDDIVYDKDGKAFDVHSGEPLEVQHESMEGKKSFQATPSMHDTTPFKARPLPPSTKVPATQPRLSKAAALRMGIKLPDPPKRSATSVSSNDENVGISGISKAPVATPKSLAAPLVMPRMNKSTATRTKQGIVEPSQAPRTKKPVDFSNTPGHKRISTGNKPASLAAPMVVPRLNKATAARASSGLNVNTIADERSRASSVSSTSSPSRERKPVDYSNTPGHKRASLSTSCVKSLQAPTIAPRSNRASLARGGDGNQVSPQAQRGSSESTGKICNANKGNGASPSTERRLVDFSNTPGHKRSSQSVSIPSLGKPSIAPRTNTATQKRLSMGFTDGASSQSRPASSMDQRPASRTSILNGDHSRIRGASSKSGKGTVPPSSFRM